jgi:hypothetical protein
MTIFARVHALEIRRGADRRRDVYGNSGHSIGRGTTGSISARSARAGLKNRGIVP